MIDYEEITEAISKTFKTTDWWVVSDECKRNKKHTHCDLRLTETAMWSMFSEFRPEAERDAVACYILSTFKDVKTIAYGGVYYSAHSILEGSWRRYIHRIEKEGGKKEEGEGV